MREKGAVVGPDTFLARTLIFAVRLSATTGGWEGARRKVGCRKVHAGGTALCLLLAVPAALWQICTFVLSREGQGT